MTTHYFKRPPSLPTNRCHKGALDKILFQMASYDVAREVPWGTWFIIANADLSFWTDTKYLLGDSPCQSKTIIG